MAITPTMGSTPRNVRSPARQSLQEAAATAQGGSAGSSDALGRLSAIMANFGNQMAQVYAQQQKEFASQKAETLRGVAAGIENFTNRIVSNMERKRERKERLADAETLMGMESRQRKADAEEERTHAYLENARRAEYDAQVEEQNATIQKNYRKAMDARTQYEDGIKVISEELTDPTKLSIYTPEDRRLLQRALGDLISDRNSHLKQQPEAIQDLLRQRGSGMRAQIEANIAAGRSDPLVAEGVPPVDTGIRLDPKTLQALRARGTSGPVPDSDGSISAPGLNQILFAMSMDAAEQKVGSDEAKLESGKKVVKAALATGGVSADWRNARGVQWGVGPGCSGSDCRGVEELAARGRLCRGRKCTNTWPRRY